MCLFPKSTQIMWLNTNSSPFFEHSIYGQISAGHFQRRKPSRGVKIREEGLFTPKHQNNLSDLQVAAVNPGHFRWTQPFLMLACFLMGACGMPLTLPQCSSMMPSTSEPPCNCWLPSGFSRGKRGSACPCGPKIQCFNRLSVLLAERCDRQLLCRSFYVSLWDHCSFKDFQVMESPLQTYFLLLWDIYIHLLCTQQYLPSKKYWPGILVA